MLDMIAVKPKTITCGAAGPRIALSVDIDINKV